MDLIKTKIENLLYKKFYDKESRHLKIRHEGVLYEGTNPNVFHLKWRGTHYIFDVALYTFGEITSMIKDMRVENSENKNSLIL